MSLDDDATATEQLFFEVAMKNRKPELQACGFCYNCSEETKGNFCCPECREDYERRERAGL